MVLEDIDIPFWKMVTFMVKWTVASVPAFIIVLIMALLLAAIVGGLGGALLPT